MDHFSLPPLPQAQGNQRPRCQAWFGEIFSSRPRLPLLVPHLLLVLAAARGPLDLLSDGAVGAGGQLRIASGNNFLLCFRNWCNFLFCLPAAFLCGCPPLGACLPSYPSLLCVCVCVCVAEDGAVFTPLSLSSTSIPLPSALMCGQPGLHGSSQPAPLDCPSWPRHCLGPLKGGLDVVLRAVGMRDGH